MAIKQQTTTVIDDTRKVFTTYGEGVWGPTAGMVGKFSDLHPKQVDTITTAIDFNKSVLKRAMTGAVTFTLSNAAAGRMVILNIDTSTSGHTPTFPSSVKFPTTPTWSNNRHWQVHLTALSATDIRATAFGFDEPGAVSSSFSNFSLAFPINWRTQDYYFSNVGWPETWCYILFVHESVNNRIKITYAHGDSGAPGSYPVQYANYTGLTGITSVEAQYNVSSQSCAGDCNASNYGWGPMPTSDGYNSGTYYTVPISGGLRFAWMAMANPNSPGGAGSSWVQANMNSSDPDFRIKIVCTQGTFYSTAQTQGDIDLRATASGNAEPF